MYQGRYEEALSELDQGAEIEPENLMVKTFRARVLYYRGEVDAATKMIEEVLERNPRMDGVRAILATCLSTQGKHELAMQQLTSRVKIAAAADHDVSYWLASAYLLQGRQVLALEWLETAINLGNENYLWFESDPNWSDLHDDARFQALMQRIKGSLEQREANPA
jgi:serine/threonine-protein kinase